MQKSKIFVLIGYGIFAAIFFFHIGGKYGEGWQWDKFGCRAEIENEEVFTGVSEGNRDIYATFSTVKGVRCSADADGDVPLEVYQTDWEGTIQFGAFCTLIVLIVFGGFGVSSLLDKYVYKG